MSARSFSVCPLFFSIGVFLILLSCVVQGSQYVFEEKLMTEENAAPLLVVGMEGVWGVLIMVLIVFPWAQMLPGSDQGACLENLADSWIMVQNSETVRDQNYTQMASSAHTHRRHRRRKGQQAVKECVLI